MGLKPEERCAEMVTELGGFHRCRCSRRGKHEEDGKLWCGQHLPSNVAKKDKEKHAKWDEEYRVKDIKYAIDAIGHEIVKCVVESYASKQDTWEALDNLDGLLEDLTEQRAALVASLPPENAHE